MKIFHRNLQVLFGCFFIWIQPHLAISFEPEAELVWSEDYENQNRILYSYYVNGEWQAPIILVDDGSVNILPVLGTTKQKQLLVWVVVKSDGFTEIRYKWRENGQWGEIHSFPNYFQTNLAPIIVSDNRDVFWLFWAANSGDDDDIFMSKWTTGQGIWSRPVQLNDDNDTPDILPDAWVDEDGALWVSWQQMDNQGNYQQVEQMVSPGIGRRTSPQKMIRNSRKQLGTFKNSFELPSYLDAKGRAVIHFRNDRYHQFKTIPGKE